MSRRQDRSSTAGGRHERNGTSQDVQCILLERRPVRPALDLHPHMSAAPADDPLRRQRRPGEAGGADVLAPPAHRARVEVEPPLPGKLRELRHAEGFRLLDVLDGSKGPAGPEFREKMLSGVVTSIGSRRAGRRTTRGMMWRSGRACRQRPAPEVTGVRREPLCIRRFRGDRRCCGRGSAGYGRRCKIQRCPHAVMSRLSGSGHLLW
jgi:hypothetical protein